ncbi:Flp family type IVb pilin [Vibrio europaeus]|uniref:Flp family type IVb pilin n=1 Tax=Vibrio europaeus TaxID=300876 RepID=UPI00233E742B|nr:Flp family type IVb pilin [Vibrio europaeus]MDC5805649.1 Flp family type IVb pilin [Vibrio europaeus]MDC5826277.1 Flp family type IVb pilin [Vibrio europaeus]MDC5831642.1 Flp family type IVb pilin [Vibrio europaeus]MDC5834597.1 Flp family type IVb pilin [Vibrio europaeus]
MKKLLNDFIKNEDGVTAIEYAVIGVAMAGLLSFAFAPNGALRTSFDNAFQMIADKIAGAK